jgi:hypothetical protein
VLVIYVIIIENLRSIHLTLDKSSVRLSSLAKEHVLYILIDKNFENINLVNDIEKAIRLSYEKSANSATSPTK